MSDSILIKWLAVGASYVSIIIILVIRWVNQIKHTTEQYARISAHDTKFEDMEDKIDDEIAKLATSVGIMDRNRDLEIKKFQLLIEQIRKENNAQYKEFKETNKDDHDRLYDLSHDQMKVISTVSAGVARIEGVMEGGKK